MAQGPNRQTGHGMPPQRSFSVPTANMAPLPSHQNPYFFDPPFEFPAADTQVNLPPGLTNGHPFPADHRFYNNLDLHSSAVNSYLSIDLDFDSNPHSNLMNYNSSDLDTIQYQFSSNSVGYGPPAPSSSSESTGHSTTPSDSVTIPVSKCQSMDPVLQLEEALRTEEAIGGIDLDMGTQDATGSEYEEDEDELDDEDDEKQDAEDIHNNQSRVPGISTSISVLKSPDSTRMSTQTQSTQMNSGLDPSSYMEVDYVDREPTIAESLAAESRWTDPTGSSWQSGQAMPPQPLFTVASTNVASPPSHQNSHSSDPLFEFSGADPRVNLPLDLTHGHPFPIDRRFYNNLDLHSYESAIDPGIDSNLHSNLTNYAHSSSDVDMIQSQFSSNSGVGDPGNQSTLSRDTSHSTIPSDPMTILVSKCRSRDPVLRELADAITSRRQSLGLESLPDLYIAQFFFVESVPSSTQPSRNKSNRSEKPRPNTILRYECLWCGDWVGYSKEKARQHFLNDLGMKRFACEESGCEWKTVRPADLARHMKLVHKKQQPTKRPGGAMLAGKSFKELQEAYRNGNRASLVDAGQSSLPVSSGSSNPTFTVDVQTPAYAQWTGFFPQFNHANIASYQMGLAHLVSPHAGVSRKSQHVGI